MKLYFQIVGQVECLSLIWIYIESENREKITLKQKSIDG